MHEYPLKRERNCMGFKDMLSAALEHSYVMVERVKQALEKLVAMDPRRAQDMCDRQHKSDPLGVRTKSWT